jgi:hypothetical protein
MLGAQTKPAPLVKSSAGLVSTAALDAADVAQYR